MSKDSVTLALDPQLAAAYKLAAEIQAELGPPPSDINGARQHAALARVWWNQGGPVMANVIEATVPGPIRPIPVVIYIPEIREHPQPAYVYLHGGGYRMGDPRSNDRQMRELAAAWGGIVVSADYVHMPEYVFPSAVEETAAVYQWLAANGAQWGIDGQRLAFGGSSAGANVALGAAIHLGGISTGFLRAGALVVGTYDGDDSDTGSMRLYADVGLFPSRASSKATLEQYVPDPAMRSDPRVKCIAADPATLPPLFLAAAEFDVFRDSSRRLAERMASAGRPYQLKEYAGMAHLFSGYTRIVDRALECVHDMAAFLKEHVPAK